MFSKQPFKMPREPNTAKSASFVSIATKIYTKSSNKKGALSGKNRASNEPRARPKPDAIPKLANEEQANAKQKTTPRRTDEDLIEIFEEHTKKIKKDLYNPKVWIDRAEAFLPDFPELAAADAYKGHMLCDEYIRQLLLDSSARAYSGAHTDGCRDVANWLLSLALNELGCRQASDRYADRVPAGFRVRLKAPNGMKPNTDGNRNPRLERHEYPWLSRHSMERDIAGVQQIMKTHSLKVQKASIADDESIMGVFATKDFEIDATVLDDPIWKVTQKPKHAKASDSVTLLDFLLTDPDFLNGVKNTESDSVQVLEDPRLKTLTISYGVPADKFSFPLQIKEVCIRLFQANKLFSLDFDFWKLFTIYWRLSTNSFSHPPDGPGSEQQRFVGVARLYSFFNHSCEPNASWCPNEKGTRDLKTQAIMEEGTKMEIKALRAIKKGEEIFISYLNAGEMNMGVAQRRKALMSWIGSDCMCTRCERQANELRKAKKVSKKRSSDNEDDDRPRPEKRRNGLAFAADLVFVFVFVEIPDDQFRSLYKFQWL